MKGRTSQLPRSPPSERNLFSSVCGRSHMLMQHTDNDLLTIFRTSKHRRGAIYFAVYVCQFRTGYRCLPNPPCPHACSIYATSGDADQADHACTHRSLSVKKTSSTKRLNVGRRIKFAKCRQQLCIGRNFRKENEIQTAW
jgi:hypothetical protein